MALSKIERRQRIKYRIKKTVSGTAQRPRLVVFRSNSEIYAQIIDDTKGVTLVAASSRDKDLKVSGTKTERAKQVGEAIAKAVEDAKKNLVRIPLNGTTLPHEQKGKFGGARVYLQPAAEGTGVIAGGAVRAVLEAVGVHNVLSKSQGSSNPHNVVKATFDALLKLRSAKTIAEQRGISLEKMFKG